MSTLRPSWCLRRAYRSLTSRGSWAIHRRRSVQCSLSSYHRARASPTQRWRTLRLLVWQTIDVGTSPVGEHTLLVYRHLDLSSKGQATASSSSSLGSRCVPLLGKYLSMPSPYYPVAVSLLSSAISYRSRNCPGRLSTAWLVSLVVFTCHMVYKWWHARSIDRSSLRRLICLAQDHFIVLTVLIISMTFVLSLSQMLVFLSLYVMLSILLSILVCAAASLFCACLVSVCTICHSWHHTGVVHLSLQADSKVAFEDIPVFGVWRPACHDSSLYLFVLVLFLEAVVLSQVHAA